MNDSHSVFSIYLAEINRIPLLSREDETRLALAAAAGNKCAKDRLVSANLRFVVSIAKKYQGQGLDLEDLVDEGNIGLMTAADKFDATKGFHFISYAVWWIRQSILKALAEKGRPIRLPANRAGDAVRIEQARKSVADAKSEQEEIASIASMLGLDAGYVQELSILSRDVVSLDASLDGGDPQSDSFMAQISASTATSPEADAINQVMKEDISAVVATLRPSEQQVLRLRYGLDGARPMSLKEVGDTVQLTKERVRQIEKNAINRMKHPRRSRILESYVA